MANTQIVCAYQVATVSPLTVTRLSNLIKGAPIDANFLQNYGLRVSADTTSSATKLITRSITLLMGPSSDATASFTLVPGDGSGSPINSVTVTAAGLDYVAPPVVTWSSTPAALFGAKSHATLSVQSVAVVAVGVGYSATPTATFSGGQLAPGGTQAAGTVTTDGAGHITGITLTNNGGPYNSVPTITITDISGSGAIITARLGVSSIVLDQQGVGYPPTGTAIAITPLFKALFPDTSSQATAVQEFMTAIIGDACHCPVTAIAPVVS